MKNRTVEGGVVKQRTIKGWCERGECDRCDGVLRSATGWNWFCTHECHPEPVVRPEHQPALDYWRRARSEQGAS